VFDLYLSSHVKHTGSEAFTGFTGLKTDMKETEFKFRWMEE
jgi:hypothetical protein